MGGLALVYRYTHHLTPLFAFLLMGMGGLGSSVVLLAYLALRLTSSQDAPSVLDTWRRHWRYGRWALGANAMMWIPINAFYPILSKFGGLAQAGELKALMNFAAPMLQACAALHTLMIPYSSRVLENRGGAGVSVLLKRMTLLCVAFAVPYWIVLLLFRGPAFRMLYSGRYTEVAYLLPVVALASIAGQRIFRPVDCVAVPAVSTFDFCLGFGFKLRCGGSRHPAHSSMGTGRSSMEHCFIRNAGFCSGCGLCPPQR